MIAIATHERATYGDNLSPRSSELLEGGDMASGMARRDWSRTHLHERPSRKHLKIYGNDE